MVLHAVVKKISIRGIWVRHVKTIGLLGLIVFLYLTYDHNLIIHLSHRIPESLNSNDTNELITKRYWELKRQILAQYSDNFDFDQALGISNINNFKPRYKLWGERLPIRNRPEYHTQQNDRILGQLLLLQDNLNHTKMQKSLKKKILVSRIMDWWITDTNKPLQFFEGCPHFASKCELVANLTEGSTEAANISAVLVLANSEILTGPELPDDVLVFFYTLESNYVSKARLTKRNDILASYWTGSDIVTPYAKWVYYNTSIRRRVTAKNYAKGKGKMVAAFVSNCNPFNTRNQYIEQLQKHIQVDVYGSCGGNLSCPRTAGNICFQKLKTQYKFYLAFENANCRDYITEKFWYNALSNDVVPVVMGAHPDDYRAACPENSYIHIEEFESARQLSEYLKHLDAHDEEYNKYFEWKGTGTLVQDYFLCRVCAMLHYADVVPPPMRSQELDLAGLLRNQLCLPRNKTYWNSKIKLE